MVNYHAPFCVRDMNGNKDRKEKCNTIKLTNSRFYFDTRHPYANAKKEIILVEELFCSGYEDMILELLY